MPRYPRIIVPGALHHVTQRGSRRGQTFFSRRDVTRYLDLLREHCDQHRVELLQYCLMPNHVHLLLRPWTSEGISKALASTHRRYARRINRRFAWTGHFWQERFFSHACHGSKVIAVARYIAHNPLRAGLVNEVGGWPHASTRDLLDLERDPWLSSNDLLGYLDRWPEFLSRTAPEEEDASIREHLLTGDPLTPLTDALRFPRAA